MPNYILNRDFTLSNTKGTITFEKGVPTNVPPYMVMDVVQIGADAVEGDTPSLVPVDKVIPVAPDGDERKAQILVALDMLVERNEAKDFTASGAPSVKAVEGILGFDVDRSEVVKAWTEFNAAKAG